MDRSEHALRARVSAFIAETMGLNFPHERWLDLERGLAGVARELGLDSTSQCIEWLLSTKLDTRHIQILARHLTIGETYFFRDQPTMNALAAHVLPELITSRRGRVQRLRLWSAACCTGEEPYTLAMLLHQLLPDLSEWQITITATDINAHFLEKAEAGIYTEWSFRDTPAHLRQRYFNLGKDRRYSVVPEVRRLVKFEHLNLVDDTYPTLVTDTNAMDLILCRNALMYFTPSQVGKVVGKLHRALVENGWLAVAPAEASQSIFSEFATVNFPGVILYRKSGQTYANPPTAGGGGSPFAAGGIIFDPPPAPDFALPLGKLNAVPTKLSQETRLSVPEAAGLITAAQRMYTQGRYGEVAETLISWCAGNVADPQLFSLLARALANQGKLADAISWCERWTDIDKMNPAAHYVHAVVLLEQGEADEARACLSRVLYLDPDFVLAHFALGNIARGRDRIDEAKRHFRTTLRLLSGYQPTDPLPESEGLTAGRLTETLTSMHTVRPAS